MSTMLPTFPTTPSNTLLQPCELCDRAFGTYRYEVGVDMCICDGCFAHATSTEELFALLLEVSRRTLA